MTYFYCFVVGSWMFALGWFLGAVYVQDYGEQMESPRTGENFEKCTACEAWRVLSTASAAAD